MAIKEGLLPELDHEMATTRKLLERVPEDKADWLPHPKSMTLGRLAIHLANLPGWTTKTMSTTELDGQSLTLPKFESRAQCLEVFDQNVARARAAIAAASDQDFLVPWTFLAGGRKIFTLPRVAALRSFVLSHSIHHRGQLSVYLRLNDVPVPSIYGPTADEPM